MRVWEGPTVLNLLRAGEDAGWVVAMIVIGFTTFAVSSIFVRASSTARRRPSYSVREERPIRALSSVTASE